ncbi:MAG: hypothetical protein L6R42_002905 [Xanthoria sp. 1 TBL-2021]|nr:MAG: hypothetical protein L6R42_002905 [Xanthoria sp. 1 TBL-2021]
MNAHVLYLGGKSNGSLLSPPSSPEMDQHLLAQEDGRWSDVQKERSMPLRAARPSFAQAYDEDSMWIQQADTINLNIHPAQEGHHALDLSNNLSEHQDSQRLAWSSTFFKDDNTNPHSAAQSDSYNQTTRQTAAVIPGEPRPSPPASQRNEYEDDDLSTGSGEDEGQSPGDVPKTAAERRAEKRKMKRFRLTHNQTRFLMSEFARQAHPDAAQRERLSREIPGLSPRQVQVWFQNRRAKLKRLTVDDQESMLKSRALPADFDNAQALNYAYDAPRHGNLVGSSSFFHMSHPEYDMRRPLITGRLSLAEENDGNISPTSVLSSFIDPSFPVSETISPISPSSESSHFFTPSTSQGTSPRASGTFTRSSSFPTIHQTPWRRHGSPLQQRLVRSRAGSSAFPISHTAKQVEQNRYDPGISSHIGHPHPYPQQIFITPSGIAPGSNPNCNLSHSTQQVKEAFGANGTASIDPNFDTCGYSPSCSIDMTAQRMYGSLGAPSQIQHSRPVRQVQSAPLAAPIDFYLPDWTTPYPPGEAGFTATLDYGQIPTTDQLWLHSQVLSPYQAQQPYHYQFQGHATMGSSYNECNATPRPGHIEEWPE